MIHITDVDDPRIDTFKSLKKLPNDEIVLDSEEVVSKYLNQGLNLSSLLTTKDFLDFNPELKNYPNTAIFFAEKKLLEKITGFRLHHGVIATAPKPQLLNINDLSDSVLVLNGVTSPENVGTIVRNAVAFGINNIIYDTKSCDPYIRRAIRVSMGNIFNANIYHSSRLLKDLQLLQTKGFDIISTDNLPNALDYREHKFSTRSALIIGSEGHGTDSAVHELANFILKIPMDTNVHAINAACASSIFLARMTSRY